MTIKDIKDGFPLRLDLQHFGGEGDPDPEGDPNPEGDPEGEPKPDPDPDKEIEKKIEAESDRKLAKALEKKEKEWEQKAQERIDEALAEKDRLSKLSEKEQNEEKLTQRELKVQEQEREIATSLLRSETVTDLQEKGLPSSFADFLLKEDAETTLENVNTFKEAYNESIKAAVKEALRQETPKNGGGSMKGGAPSISEIAQENRIIK